jgi:hypothetical protein
MAFVGNLLWFIFGGGIFSCILWFLGGLLLCVTVVGIPFGLAAFRIARFAAFPFGKELVDNRLLGGTRIAGTGWPISSGSSWPGCGWPSRTYWPASPASCRLSVSPSAWRTSNWPAYALRPSASRPSAKTSPAPPSSAAPRRNSTIASIMAARNKESTRLCQMNGTAKLRLTVV